MSFPHHLKARPTKYPACHSLLRGETTDASGCTAYSLPCRPRHSFTEVTVPDMLSSHGSFANASLYEINPNQLRWNHLPLPTDSIFTTQFWADEEMLEGGVVVAAGYRECIIHR